MKDDAALTRREFVIASGALAAGNSLMRLAPAFIRLEREAAPNILALSLVDLATAISRGRVRSETAVRAYLDRIDAVDPRLNAVVQLAREAAVAAARAADRVPLARRGALHGVPITIKDSLDTAGIVSTGGTKGRATFVPSEDATVVRRLRAAGAIILGKTNTPDLTLSYETNNLVYGRTNNPYDLERTSGGSSGGAAAIIAAGGSPLDIGSDTGGSIRLPAHFCGITGHKPTAGRVPRTGHIIGWEGVAERLTHLGPLAKRVDDVALVLSIIAGPDGVDPHVVPVTLRNHRSVHVRGLRVAYFINLPPVTPTPNTATAVERAVRTLERAGCRVRAIDIPESDGIYARYTAIMWSDGGAAVARILDRWGTTESPLRARISQARTATSSELIEVFEKWDQWRSAMLRLFTDYDVIVCPVNSAPAPLHGTFDRASAAYTQLFNLTGWPVTVVRAGTSPERLPIGVQCVAHPWREDVSLAVARHLESAFGAWPGSPVPGSG